MKMNRGKTLHITGLLVGLIFLCSPPSAAANDEMDVPGGIDSVARLLGYVSNDSAEFGFSVNRVLLGYLAKGGEWEGHQHRTLLVEHARAVQELDAFVGERMEITRADKPGRKRFEKLAKMLGYQVKRRKGRLEVIAADGSVEEDRRRIAIALGWDFVAAARDLSDGEPVVFELRHDRAESPLAFDRWKRLSKRQIDSRNALMELAMDQSIGFYIEGMRRLNRETADLIEDRLSSFVYNEVPEPFFRYSSSFEVLDGELVVPGGPGASPMWQQIVGVSPNDPVAFIKGMLDERGAVGAYLWHALFFAPPETAAYFTGQTGSSSRNADRYFRKFRGRLRDMQGAIHFARARGRVLGFAAFARSVPISPDGESLDLPGGARLWFDAIKSADVPQGADGVARVAAKSAKKPMPEDEFVLKAVTERVDLSGFPQLALPRLIRIGGFFYGRESLLTPANVILVGRVSDRYPMALAAIEQMSLTSPETLGAYLMTVAHLGELSRSPDTHVLVGNFQGGVELVRILDRAGRVDHAVLEKRLEEWSEFHRSASVAEDVASRQLSWLIRVLEELPEVSEDSPGRGPIERALLAAINGRRDPQAFSWHGLDYTGQRGRDLALKSVDHLDVQQIPEADRLFVITEQLANLETACGGADLAAAHQAASSLIDLFINLPNPKFDPPLEGSQLISQLTPADRLEIVELIRKVRSIKKAKKLSKLGSTADDVRRLMGRELRPFLLAPTYAVGMAEGDSPLFGDPTLVWRHTMVRDLDRLTSGDDPWHQTVFISSSDSTFGSHLAGHVAGVAQALVRLHLGRIGTQDEAALQNLPRDQFWLDSVATTPWHDMTTEISAAVASAIALGEATVYEAVNEGLSSDTMVARACRGVIPLARLEREAMALASDDGKGPKWVSPGELLNVGLEVAGEFSGEAESNPELEPLVALFRAAAEAVGPDWRDQIDRVGSPTPQINGRGNPWVGWWPPYEAIENEGPLELLNERQLIDLRLRVLEYMGRLGLAGDTGSDLMMRAVLDASLHLHIETLHDWEGFLLWLRTLDDNFFDEGMRQCFAVGLYSAQL